MKINLVDALDINERDSLPTKDRKIEAMLTGHYPNLCYGEWIITVDGKQVSLPEEIRRCEMDTFGIYQRWNFGPDWEEQWEDYEAGLEFEPWLQKNSWWVSKLGLSDTETQTLYEVIREEDWRHGSCGGCI